MEHSTFSLHNFSHCIRKKVSAGAILKHFSSTYFFFFKSGKNNFIQDYCNRGKRLNSHWNIAETAGDL